MGSKYKDVGGGPAVGVADDWSRFLQSMLSGGSMPGMQMDRATNRITPGSPNNMITGNGGISGVLSDILSGGAGNLGGSLQRMLASENMRSRNELRSRFSSIGGGYGSGAGQAEALFNSEAAARQPLAIGQLQMSAIGPLMQYLNDIAGKGISQRQTVEQKNPFLQGAQALAGIGSAAASFATGGGAGNAALDVSGMAPKAYGTGGGFKLPNVPAGGGSSGFNFGGVPSQGFDWRQFVPQGGFGGYN